MTTEQLTAAFPPGNSRPSRWRPGAYAEYDDARRAGLAADRFAASIMARYTHTDFTAGEEAAVWQALGLIDRFAAALMLETVLLWETGAS